MSRNLLLWKRSPEFDSPTKRKKAKVKLGETTTQFATNGHHPAIGAADITVFRIALEAAFRSDELARPCVLELHPKCAAVNYSETVRFELVPKVAEIGRRFGLNASEF